MSIQLDESSAASLLDALSDADIVLERVVLRGSGGTVCVNGEEFPVTGFTVTEQIKWRIHGR